MADAARYKAWLDGNKDKAGTPEYVEMNEAYQQASGTPSTEEPFAYTDQGIPVGSGTGGGGFAQDPLGITAGVGRAATGVPAGIPDLAISIGNAGVRASQSLPPWLGMAGVQPGTAQEAPTVGPKLNRLLGIPELPENASPGRALLEAGGSALMGGGANSILRAIQAAPTAGRAVLPALRALSVNTVAPTTLSAAGGVLGEAAGTTLGLDAKTTALIGSMLGGIAPGAANRAPTSITDWMYRGQGKDNAGQLLDTADRLGIRLNAGTLGNEAVQTRENMYTGRWGSADVTNTARAGAREGIGNAWDDMAARRGAVTAEPTTGTIGEDLAAAMRGEADRLRDRSDQRQSMLQNRIGADAPVRVTPFKEQAYGIMTDPQVGLSASGRRGIDQRIAQELNPLLDRDASGQPLMTPGPGHNMPPPGGLPGDASETVPYGPFRGFRTDLGRSIDTEAGGRLPPASLLYSPATRAMEATAMERGVPLQDFRNVQDMTRAIERTTAETPGGLPGDYQALMDIGKQKNQAAYDYLRQGMQQPSNLDLIEATQSPAVPGIMGDYLRLMGQSPQSISGPNQSAVGPKNLAQAVETMHPESLQTLAGPEAQNATDIAALARAYNRPTSQAGLTRSQGAMTEGIPGTLTTGEVGAHIGSTLPIPYGASIGRIAGYLSGPIRRLIDARAMQGPVAANAMAGRAGPAPPAIADLISAMNAAAATRGQQYGPRSPAVEP